MSARALLRRARRLLWQSSHSPWYLPLLGLLSLAATLSVAVPVTTLLVPGVMLRPQRWRLIALAAVLGSALAATLLVYGFHQEGWSRLQLAYPEVAASDTWKDMVNWVEQYGLVALAAICALPLPQTPALIACAVADPSLMLVFLAVASGKLLKYGLVCWTVATFPERFIRYLHRDEQMR